MDSSFSVYLRSLVSVKGTSLRRLAIALGQEPPTLAGILAGRRPMPVAHIAKLADVLDLNAREREELRVRVLLTHCPEEISTMLMALRAEVSRLRGSPAKRRRG